MPPHHFAKVVRFNEMIGYHRPLHPGLTLRTSDELTSMRVMLREEFKETMEALDVTLDENEFLDGLADLAFVIMGCFHKVGANFDVVMDAVCESNLTKTPGDKGRGIARDATKEEGKYVPPRFSESPDLWTGPLDDKMDAMTTDLHGVRYPLLEAASLRMTKAKDYMSGGVSRSDYNPFGLLSYVHNVVEKAMRAKSIVTIQAGGGEPNHEGLRDTLIDIINYASFAIEFIDGNEADR